MPGTCSTPQLKYQKQKMELKKSLKERQKAKNKASHLQLVQLVEL